MLPRHIPFVYVASIAPAMGGLIYGCNLGSIAGAILFIRGEFHLSATIQEVLISAVLFGAVPGSALAGLLADRIGRRSVLLLTSVTCIAGALGTALAPTVVWLTGFRLLTGCAVGLVSVAGPLYVAEIAPAQIRGRLVSYFTIAAATGIFVAYLADYTLSAHGHWRWMLGLGAIPGALLGAGMLYMPESPRWLLSHAYPDRARAALSLIETDNVAARIQAIRASLAEQGGTWKELASASVRPALLVGIGLAICREAGGANSFRVYAPTLFEFAGFSSAGAAILLTVVIGVANLLMAFVAMRMVDRAGRRPLLLLGIGGIIASLIALGLAYLFSNMLQGDVLGWLSFAAVTLLMSSWMIGPGIVTRLLHAEIFPLRVRGRALGLASVVQWGVYALVTLPFLTLFTGLGPTATLWLYALFGVAALIFCYRYVPETKGRTLEQIEEHWRMGRHAREMDSREPASP